MARRLTRNDPRDIIPERVWYYVNNSASVDLLVRDPGVHTMGVRLTRQHLQRMLRELQQIRTKKRAATKHRSKAR